MKRRAGNWTNGGSKESEREHRGRESVTVQSISTALAREMEGGRDCG